MTGLLYVNSSPREGRSESRPIAQAFLDAYRAERPEASIDVLDLWAEPLPLFAGDHVAAKMSVIGGVEHGRAQRTAWDEILAVARRFQHADAYLFTVPMWNHGVPWVLKHLIDTISQPGVTFGFGVETGYTGLLDGKRPAAVYTRAIWPRFGNDFHASYFEDWLRFLGVEDIHSVSLGADLLDAEIERERQRARLEAAGLGRLFASGGAARPPAPPALHAVR